MRLFLSCTLIDDTFYANGTRNRYYLCVQGKPHSCILDCKPYRRGKLTTLEKSGATDSHLAVCVHINLQILLLLLICIISELIWFVGA